MKWFFLFVCFNWDGEGIIEAVLWRFFFGGRGLIQSEVSVAILWVARQLIPNTAEGSRPLLVTVHGRERGAIKGKR